jgi:prepilin-type N-terminal cleavage/methylation domain-containing protein
MRMWAFLRTQHLKQKHGSDRGFTLLEILTVLLIVGLSVGLVAPNLPGVLDRVSFALERDTLIRELNTLPYKAAGANLDFVLVGEFAYSNPTNTESALDEFVDVEELDISVPYRSGGIRMATLSVPQDWSVYVPEPIFFRSSGFCTGGSVIVNVGQFEYALSAQAPYCQFSESDQ